MQLPSFPDRKASPGHHTEPGTSSPGGATIIAHKVDIALPHALDASRIAQLVIHVLHCDTWYVACQREHQLVIHLTRASADCYALCLECSPPVEKAIYHGSRATHLSIVPLHGNAELSPDEQHEIRRLLAQPL